MDASQYKDYRDIYLKLMIDGTPRVTNCAVVWCLRNWSVDWRSSRRA